MEKRSPSPFETIAAVNTEIEDGSKDPGLPDLVIATIGTDGRMPLIHMHMNLNPGYTLVQLRYSAHIEYTNDGRNDRSQTVTGISTSIDYDIEFGSPAQGGLFKIAIAATIRDRYGVFASSLNLVSSVRGENPNKEIVKSHLGSLTMRILAYKESRFRQFDSKNLPLFGPPRGFGVMQIDTPPATARQLWDWTDNVAAGVALFKVKEADAEGFPARERKRAFPDATDFTADQLKLEAVQRYNGGAYWAWNDAEKKWVRENMSNYTDSFTALEKQVLEGNYPAEW